MSEPRDDDLAAMLEARADRLPPTATREVLAAVRGEIQRPKGGALFSVVPVTRTRGMNGPAGWAAVGLVAVLVLAVMGGRLDTRPSMPAGSGAGSGSPLVTTGASAGPAATALAPMADTVTIDQLREGITDGKLNGRIVLLTGSLTVTPLRCLGDCQLVEVSGLEGVAVTYWWEWASAADVRAAIDAHPGPGLMAFRVDGPEFVLLGWVTQGAQVAFTVNGLLGQASPLGRGDVAVVSGWLTPGSPGPSCPLIGEPTTPCNSGPRLSDGPPVPDGWEIYAQSVNVGLDASVAFGAGSTAVVGAFLVRQVTAFGGGQPPYQVVASLNPETTVQVVPASLIAAEEQLLRELEVKRLLLAIKDGSLDGRMVLVTGALEMVAWPCPSDVQELCTRFLIPGLDGVAVTWDGPVWTAAVVDGASPGPPPIRPTADTLVVTPRDGRLVLLGRLTGDLERPDSLQELVSRRGQMDWRDPIALTAVSGWLVVGGVHSCVRAPDATPCPPPPPRLTNTEPDPDGFLKSTVETEVAIWPSAVGIDSEEVVTPGPFLYRIAAGSTCDGLDRSEGWTCAGGPTWTWEVMARYDIDSVTRVVLP